MDRFNWKNLSKENTDRNYNLRVAVHNAQDYIDEFIDRFIFVREKIQGIFDIRYEPNQNRH